MDTKNYLIFVFLWENKTRIDDEALDIDEAYNMAKEIVSDYINSSQYEQFTIGQSLYGNIEMFRRFVDESWEAYF